MHRRRALPRGFTLVELLITIVVVGILVSIAYPAYTEHLRKSRRAEAQQVLMDIALRQQQPLLLLQQRGFGRIHGVWGLVDGMSRCSCRDSTAHRSSQPKPNMKGSKPQAHP